MYTGGTQGDKRGVDGRGSLGRHWHVNGPSSEAPRGGGIGSPLTLHGWYFAVFVVVVDWTGRGHVCMYVHPDVYRRCTVRSQRDGARRRAVRGATPSGCVVHAVIQGEGVGRKRVEVGLFLLVFYAFLGFYTLGAPSDNHAEYTIYTPAPDFSTIV